MAVVLDPPYVVRARAVSSEGDNSATIHKYREGLEEGRRTTAREWREGRVGPVDRLYLQGARQAHLLLQARGILILKTQDEIRSGHFVPKGLQFLALPGYELQDLFIVVQPQHPMMDPKWRRQQHARKNHSYFIVHRKCEK